MYLRYFAWHDVCSAVTSLDPLCRWLPWPLPLCLPRILEAAAGAAEGPLRLLRRSFCKATRDRIALYPQANRRPQSRFYSCSPALLFNIQSPLPLLPSDHRCATIAMASAISDRGRTAVSWYLAASCLFRRQRRRWRWLFVYKSCSTTAHASAIAATIHVWRLPFLVFDVMGHMAYSADMARHRVTWSNAVTS